LEQRHSRCGVERADGDGVCRTGLEVTGEHARCLLLGGHDDVYGVLANMGMRQPPRWQLWFTLAAMVAVLYPVIAGATLALIVGGLAKGGLASAGGDRA
jgi:hypothetical protein